MSRPPDSEDDPFLKAFRGSFTSALRWHHLDALWAVLRERASDGWFVYAVGEPPPTDPATADEFRNFLSEIDKLLRREHQEDYCGIVYADDLRRPALVKIYDPHNLGVVCGHSESPPLPGWVLSRLQPCDLKAAQPMPGGRKRWWRALFG